MYRAKMMDNPLVAEIELYLSRNLVKMDRDVVDAYILHTEANAIKVYEREANNAYHSVAELERLGDLTPEKAQMAREGINAFLTRCVPKLLADIENTHSKIVYPHDIDIAGSKCIKLANENTHLVKFLEFRNACEQRVASITG